MPGQPPNPSLVGSRIQNSDSATPVSYQITDWLRSTGVVDTYLAAHVGVAIKIELKHFNPIFTALSGFAERFAHNIKPLVTLNVGSLIKVYDYGVDSNRYFMVVEYHKSPTLRARLENETRLPLSNAVDYIRQMGEALGQAASSGVLHGLLTPDSITLTSKRGALIGDIGLAPIFGDSLARVLARTPQISAYAAPELVMGQPLTVSHDLYALTSLLYEMTTGQLPYPNATPFQVGALPVPNPANLDRALVPLTALVQRGLAKNPADRFNSYDEFEIALRDMSAPPAARVLTPPVVVPKTEIVEDDFAGQTISDMPAFNTPPPARKPTPPPVPAPKQATVEDDFAGQTISDMPAFNTPPPARKPTPPPVPAPKQAAVEDDFAGQTISDMPVFNTPPPARKPTPPPVPAPKQAAVEDDFAGQTISDMPVFNTPPPARIPTPPPVPAPKQAAVEDDFAGQTISDMPVFNTPPPARIPTPPPAAPRAVPPPPPAVPDKPIVIKQPPAPGRPPPSSSNISVPPAAKVAPKRDNPPAVVPPTPPPKPPPAAPAPKPAPVKPQPPAEPNFSARTMLEVPGLQQPSAPPSFNTAPPSAGPSGQPSYQTVPRQGDQRSPANAPYSMPTVPPGGSSIPPQSAVPYNFGSVPPSYPGAQVTTPRQLDQRYSTSVMNRAMGGDSNPSSGVTGFLSAYEGDKGAAKPKRKTSPLLLIIVLLVVLLIAAGIGFVVLKATGAIG